MPKDNKLSLKKGKIKKKILSSKEKDFIVTDEYVRSLYGSSKTNGKVLKSLFKDKKIEREL